MGPTKPHNTNSANPATFQAALVFVVLFLMLAGGNVQARQIEQFSWEQFSTDDNILYITDSWKFSAGDDFDWADPQFEDSTWESVSTYLGPSELPFIEWEGIGWFRLTFRIDSSLVNYPLAILIEQHHGASEVYLDGKLMLRLGDVSPLKDYYRPYRDNRPHPFLVTDTTTHVLAVRFSNHDAATYTDFGLSSGFRFLLGDLDYHIAQSVGKEASNTRKRVFYSGLLLAFTLIHALLFLFYPSEKRNLYFALFTGFLTLLTFSIIESDVVPSPLSALTFYRVSLVAWILTVLYALRFSYSLFYEKVPKIFWAFLGIGLSLAAGTWFTANNLRVFRELFVLITIIEIIRVLTISFFKKRDGVWVIGTGLLSFVFGLTYTTLANLDIFIGDPILGNLYGSVGLILGMSVYLSREFATTNKRLQHKLIEVKHLSELSLKQERDNQRREIERKLLEAENQRKSNELEEARVLQLSMLPSQLPDSEYWDIAVYMETAQEVGGDYYDFSFDTQGTMSVALGDATGHGLKAGIMVATAKSYFHTLANDYNLVEMLKRMSSGIRNMNLRMMYMSMLFIKCKGHTVEYASAGMPPVLHYKSASSSVERVLMKGMPLGTNIQFPYSQKTITANVGDSLVLMSDGLMERFNAQREQFGLHRISEALEETGPLGASEILARIIEDAKNWAGEHLQEDDITVMVLTAKKPEA